MSKPSPRRNCPPDQRSLPRFGTRTAIGACLLLCLSACGSGRLDDSDPMKSQAEELMMESLRVPDATSEAPIALTGGQGHSYTFPLAAGQVMTVRVEQEGIDVELRLHTPEGGPPLSMDSPNGSWAPEELTWVAAAPGTFRLEVVCENQAAPTGQYRLIADPPRAASDADRHHAALLADLCQADALRRSPQTDSLPEALRLYRRCADAWRELKRPAWQVRAIGGIAEVARRSGDAVTQVAAYHQAVEVARAAGLLDEAARVENGLARHYLEQNDVATARATLERAQALAHAHGDEVLVSQVELNLAEALRRGQQLDEALRVVLRAEKVFERHQRPLDRADALHNRGETLSEQGLFAEAARTFGRASALRQTHGDPVGWVQEQISWGEVLLRQDRPQEAVERLLAAHDSPNLHRLDPRWSRLLSNSLGLAYRQLDAPTAPAEALRFFDEAHNLAEEAGDLRFAAIVDFNLGAFHQSRQQPAEALHHFERALPVFENWTDGAHRVAMAKLGIGLALRDQGDLLAALEQIEAATDIVETLRLQRASVQYRVWYLASKQRYFEELVDLLAQLHLDGASPASGLSYAERALQAAERKRARTFLDAFGEPTPRQHASADQLLRERTLMDEIEALQAQLYAADGDEAAAIRERQDDLLVYLDSVRGEIRSAHPDYRQAERPAPLNVEQIRGQVLDDDSTLVVYSLGERRSFAWTLDRDTELELHVLAGRERLRQSVKHALDVAVTRAPTAKPRRDAALARLGDSLLGFLGELPAKPRLVIVADGPLEQVPFAALQLPDGPALEGAGPGGGGRRYLLETHEIALLPSASSLGAIRRAGHAGARPRSTIELALFADPVFSTDDERLATGSRPSGTTVAITGGPPLSRLPFSRQEAEAIAALFPLESRELALDFAARKDERFWQLLQGAALLHFATHSWVDGERPQLSALALSQVDEQGRPIAGYVYAHELFATRLAAELVVLSACGTGTGREIAGEGVQGLSRAFLYAGAPRVVMSLWNVDDLSTAHLMEHFYRRLLSESEAPATALRHAQLQFLHGNERWAAPYFWAPFALVGDWRVDRESRSDDGNPFEKEQAGVAQAPPAGTTPGYPIPPDDPPPQQGRPPVDGY